ncbi:hypothetical protein [Leeia aquatica]|uniref:Uncharacterized protein n=1 Tax=Leeia aquatica TaxID=2725557 RepID=A0A847S9J9_9NEIS|nr:hypothetical protein [Leeia aquatica]NLR74246.1 hypothetical protein [Leeia aquatica]
MAAKELMIFTPSRADMQFMLDGLVEGLALKVDELPDHSNFSFEFSAQKGNGREYFLLEYRANDLDVIHDISEWDRPSGDIKRTLLACGSRITIYYRNISLAKEAFLFIGQWFGGACKSCVVENGFGCLLTLDALVENISSNSEWSWEREAFPEVPGVAVSEWIDLLTIFTPSRADMQFMLDGLVESLALKVDELPDKLRFGFKFSAQRGRGKGYLLLEYHGNNLDFIHEISQWDRPADDMRETLLACGSKITIHYRNINLAKEAVLLIGKWFGGFCKNCVVENGFGCLLALDALVENISNNSEWSWEREEFPEVPGVAVSEWIDF